MGKESKLRNTKDNGTRYEYTNGDRKLYDRDAVPKRLDENVWSLALFFEQHAENNLYATPGRHIIYTELYHRIAADSDFAELLSVDDPSLTTLARVSQYTYGVLEDMITEYWDSLYGNTSATSNQCINDFCSIVVFNYLKRYIIETIERKKLIETGLRVPVTKIEIKPSRRTEKDRISAEIDNKTYTEQEFREKVEHWQRDHNNTPEE